METRMGDADSQRFTIFGAGLAGPLLAIYLAQQGKTVELFERRPDPRTGVADAGRSINLAMSVRGLTALAGVGLDQAALASAIPMRGRLIHRENGKCAYQPYGHRRDQAINSVSRAGLNRLLIEAADAHSNVTIRFGVRCLDVDFDRRRARIKTLDNSQEQEIETGVVIGADGAFSAVRESMRPRVGFNFSQDYLPHGYKELTIAPTSTGADALEPNALHIWPRGGFMMIALPNADHTFTCTLFYPRVGPNSAAEINTPTKATAFFEQHFPDALALMPTFEDDYQNNPAGALATMRCFPWHVEGHGLLVGDAAHAVVPFYGQGMNAAFEDCRVLDEMMRAAPNEPLERVFARFSEQRKPNADAIADLAIHNYVEMRDTVNSPMFRLKKWTERVMAKFVPGYQPLYEMVSFSNIPYARAVRIARRRRGFFAGALCAFFFVLILLRLWG